MKYFSPIINLCDVIIAHSRCETGFIENHGQKQLRLPCFVKRVNFSISNFHISTPSPLFIVVTTWQCQRSIFQHWKGGEGGLAIDKRRFLNYGRTSTESVFLFKCVNTFVLDCSFIVWRYKQFRSGSLLIYDMHQLNFIERNIGEFLYGIDHWTVFKTINAK